MLSNFAEFRHIGSISAIALLAIVTPTAASAECPAPDTKNPREYYCTDATGYISIPYDLFVDHFELWKVKVIGRWELSFDRFAENLPRDETPVRASWEPSFSRRDRYMVLLECNNSYSWDNRRVYDFRNGSRQYGATYMQCSG